MRRCQTRPRAGLALLAAACGALLPLAGCLVGHPRLTAAEAPVFRPEVFFDGPSQGTGTVRIRTRAAQPLRVESRGRAFPGGLFRLDQTVTVGDGPPRRRTWTMTRTADGAYVATLTDADGPVELTVDGAELRIRYRLGAGTTMSQRLVLRPDGQSALNLATVRTLGVVVARVEEEIVRDPRPAPDGRGRSQAVAYPSQ